MIIQSPYLVSLLHNAAKLGKKPSTNLGAIQIVNYDEATEEHSIDVLGDITAMFKGANPSDTENYQQSESSIKLVAGVGFEPTTFRL